jgi:hypothetical protein
MLRNNCVTYDYRYINAREHWRDNQQVDNPEKLATLDKWRRQAKQNTHAIRKKNTNNVKEIQSLLQTNKNKTESNIVFMRK